MQQLYSSIPKNERSYNTLAPLNQRPHHCILACQQLQTSNSTAPLLLETNTARQHGIVDCEHENTNDSTARLLVTNKKRTTVQHFCFTTSKNKTMIQHFCSSTSKNHTNVQRLCSSQAKIKRQYNTFVQLKQKS